MNPPERPAPNSKTAPIGWTLTFGAWLIAMVLTLGSLFFGEVTGYTPCVLCWYQRIAMFPLVLVLAAGLFPFDQRVVRYALPLAVAGWGLALFHLAVIAGWVGRGFLSVNKCICRRAVFRLAALPARLFHHERSRADRSCSQAMPA